MSDNQAVAMIAAILAAGSPAARDSLLTSQYLRDEARETAGQLVTVAKMLLDEAREQEHRQNA